MKYSAHKLLNSTNGFKPAITPSDKDISHLKQVRKLIRQSLRQAFSLVSESMMLDSAQRWKVKSETLAEPILQRLQQLSATQKSALKNLRPKFASQGSFVYRTMNTPCHQPPQQMDLDDGIYLPIDVLKEGPIVGKDLFFKIVDSTLSNLAKANNWKFIGDKPTCARLIVAANMHVDVPLYAIPREKYDELAFAEAKARANIYDSVSLVESKKYLDSDDVYLAVRNQEHWIKSDPAKISRWFTGSVQDQGEILRRTCRYLKAWRDNIFIDGIAPSSITLMVCTVESFSMAGKRFKDDSEALLHCVNQLHEQLSSGVSNPTDETEPNLFPRGDLSEEDKEIILSHVDELQKNISYALLKAPTQQIAIQYFTKCFGDRLPDKADLITNAIAAEIMSKPAKPQPEPKVKTMKAG